MREKLVERLEDIPGVSSVSLNLDDAESGVRVRLEEDADESEVLERVQTLLVAYGIRSPGHQTLEIGNRTSRARALLGVDVRISQLETGARVEVVGTAVRSFRVVPPTPFAIAQGLCDSWSQVVGHTPMEVTGVTVSEDDLLSVTVSQGTETRTGRAEIVDGWALALALAVARAMGVVDPEPGQGAAE